MTEGKIKHGIQSEANPIRFAWRWLNSFWSRCTKGMLLQTRHKVLQITIFVGNPDLSM